MHHQRFQSNTGSTACWTSLQAAEVNLKCGRHLSFSAGIVWNLLFTKAIKVKLPQNQHGEQIESQRHSRPINWDWKVHLHQPPEDKTRLGLNKLIYVKTHVSRLDYISLSVWQTACTASSSNPQQFIFYFHSKGTKHKNKHKLEKHKSQVNIKSQSLIQKFE